MDTGACSAAQTMIVTDHRAELIREKAPTLLPSPGGGDATSEDTWCRSRLPTGQDDREWNTFIPSGTVTARSFHMPQLAGQRRLFRGRTVLTSISPACSSCAGADA